MGLYGSIYGPIWALVGPYMGPYGHIYKPIWAHMGPYGSSWTGLGRLCKLSVNFPSTFRKTIWTNLARFRGPYTKIESLEIDAVPGLGPSPGWGPVRVGAHMGPYGPLWALMGPYGPIWVLLDRSWKIT